MVILSTIAMFFLIIMLTVFALVIFEIIACYKMFEKAGVEGWKSIIPIYNLYVMNKEVAKIDDLWFFLTLLIIVPVIGQIVCAVALLNIHYSVVRRFSKDSDIRILGTIFFSIYVLFAGFGNLKYDNSPMNRNGFFQDSTIDNIKGNNGSTSSSTSNTTSGSSKFCKNCGNPINPGDKFCQNYGNKL